MAIFAKNLLLASSLFAAACMPAHALSTMPMEEMHAPGPLDALRPIEGRSVSPTLGEINDTLRANRDLRRIVVFASRNVDIEGDVAADFETVLRMVDFSYSVLEKAGGTLVKAKTKAEADLAASVAVAVMAAEEDPVLADFFEALAESGLVERACAEDPMLSRSAYCVSDDDLSEVSIPGYRARDPRATTSSD